ncbi:C4-type zinc ribbon domain-containing protein [Fulvivirga maritima]|uniref:zinc ribbon domain-containing protein n=1 Tax=Fulvivirga maritima TaxID=2904247 RepID=UPI001F3FB95D|nr:C4-type zinc ribbon domain-containing protein [Fulvivirga maritima]UII24920.1 C4-type zinc ribbon domain-containing protein [Fulvivirga maritima]
MENTSVAQKLEALVKLQSIDSKLDEIKKLRGDLPDEVQDLEDEIEGYKTRLGRFNTELEELEQSIKDNKNGIKDAEKLIAKYSEQQNNVRNNREYDAITKEVELQQLEIQILEKKTKEAHEAIERKKGEIENINEVISERSADLENKQQELKEILEDSKDEEEKLLTDREKAGKKIEPKLFKYYEKLRANLSNGLAVVTVKRGAAEGCNIVIPPQKIAEIREKKKIVIDEHSGRILADVDMESLEEEKPKRTTRRKKKA